MRTFLLALTGLASLTQAAVNITETNEVDLAAGTGTLGWGASGLPFGYSAGSGLNFNEETQELGGGFNGAIPGESDGAFGGGLTVNSSTVTLGLGGVLGGTSFNVEVVEDRGTGTLTVLVNGKEVAL